MLTEKYVSETDDDDDDSFDLWDDDLDHSYDFDYGAITDET